MRRTAIVLSVIVLLAWFAYLATGSRYSGKAAGPSNIPLVGEQLTELTFGKPATYRGFEHPHGGGTFTITGTVTPDSLARFCDRAEISLSHNGTNVQDRDAILEYLGNQNIELPDSSPDAPLDVLFGFGGRFRKLYGAYDSTTQRLVMTLQFDGSK